MFDSEATSKLELKHSIQSNPGGNVTQSGINITTEKVVAPGTLIGGTVGLQKMEASSGASSDMKTAGVFGSQVTDLGKTSISFTDKSGRGPAGREHHTDLTLGHAFPVGEKAVVGATLGHETHHVGAATARGITAGLQGKLETDLGVTSAAFKDTTLSGAGISEHHQSTSLRHDFGIGDNSKLGASIFQQSQAVGSFNSQAHGFGLHASTVTGAGTTGLDFINKTTTSPFGVGGLQSTSLTHQIPLSNNTFLEGFGTHNTHMMPGGKTFDSNMLGLTFGMKF
ncbi:hypothetical protein AAG570_013588 [Ranatra chinensis]|uniref:Uncharacterized protein n=1 Tax=Ranatra chinensis TaxID=642074 RepID=A0ABD0YCM1_9HEMI